MCRYPLWCRDNVYFPIYGWSRKPLLGLFASMLVMGLWHRLNVNWAFWGIYHATGMMLVNQWARWKKGKAWLLAFGGSILGKALNWWMTFWYVALGYAFVSVPKFPDAIHLFIGALQRVVVANF